MEIYWVSMTKCYSDQNKKVAAYLHNSNQKLVKYFVFNYTNGTSETTEITSTLALLKILPQRLLVNYKILVIQSYLQLFPLKLRL